MDLTPTIQANSDQLNADDLISGPVTVQIQEVVAGNAEQPVHIRLHEFPGKTYRPSKSMRRVLIAAWGKEASVYAGRRLELFRNPDIRFGREVVGGIQISRMSDLDGPLTVALTVSRGKKSQFTVQPLDMSSDPAIAAAIETLEQASSLPALKTAWDLAGTRGVQSHPDVVAVKERRKQELGES